ncbi:fused response regulator/phosphatase [Roseibium sp.]|uniref:ATP-binding SpoIIE family protein phosphatase n=1 Tax=Roseibium sp. TaxID=1936156 RepID=UPI003264E9D0
MVGTALTSSDFTDPGSAPGSGLLELGTLANARLLLIDDSRFARKTINAILANHGFTNVKSATDGEEGLRVAREWLPELIITDLFMPLKTGFDLCRELREEGAFQETPIIVQTSSDTPALRGDVFEAGASDLINKPINARELLSRIRVHLERLRLIDSLKSYRHQMREELNSAKAMQMELLPADQAIDEMEQEFPLKFAWHSQPCQGLAGDIWGAEKLDDHRIRIWNADFTGHGVKSALNTFRLNTFLRTSLKDDRQGPGDWLATVNDFLCEVLPVGQFATMLCCDIDFRENMIDLASAGAPQPILEKNGRNEVVSIGGMPLGISDGVAFDQIRLPFPVGSCLFAYSDALTETPSAEAPLYDMDPLIGRLDELTSIRLTKRPLALVGDLAAVAPGGLDDDLTLIFLEHVKVKGGRDELNAFGQTHLATEKVDETEEPATSPLTSQDKYVIRTMQDAEELTTRLAAQYPEPDAVRTGIWELLANAIEHGNLAIRHEEKTELLLANKLNNEIEARLSLPVFRDRRVQVEFEKSGSQIKLKITDEGEGFDFQTYLDGEARLDAPNGRGIAIAQKLSFDDLIYRGKGNIVEAVVELSAA